MDRKICLDTDICIEIAKKNYFIEYIFDKFAECDIYISSITIFELFLRDLKNCYSKKELELVNLEK